MQHRGAKGALDGYGYDLDLRMGFTEHLSKVLTLLKQLSL